MAIATAGTALLGAGIGAAKFFEGRKMQREAQNNIDQFKWQDLENPYENLQVSRLGADLRAEEASRNTATSVDALRSGGARALVGGLGRVQAENNLISRDIGAGLDEQQKKIDQMAAQDEAMQRAMIEQRQTDELQGYGQAMNVGMGLKHQGLGNIYNSVASATTFGAEGGFDGIFGKSGQAGAGGQGAQGAMFDRPQLNESKGYTTIADWGMGTGKKK